MRLSAFLLANPDPQHVGPITDGVQKHAFAADELALKWQEIDQETTRIVRGGWRSSTLCLTIIENPALPSRATAVGSAVM
jgi:hypothetical protein